MSWQHVRISRFGGPEVSELAEEPTIPNPGNGEVRIKVLQPGPVSRAASFGVAVTLALKDRCRLLRATS
jgi:hypothetical protein